MSYPKVVVKLSLLTWEPLFNAFVWGEPLNLASSNSRHYTIQISCDMKRVSIYWTFKRF